MTKPLIIGIAGGTGSGKTTLAHLILQRVGADKIGHIMHDSYYNNNTHLSLEERRLVDFDHPDALENDLLIKHLMQLRAGKPAEIPVYDYTVHLRTGQTETMPPYPVIIVEGILIFSDHQLAKQLDIKVFVDTADDLRFIRRLKRDIEERGRTMESVINQYLNTVRPGHHVFVQPSIKQADVVIREGGRNAVAIEMIEARIRQHLASYN